MRKPPDIVHGLSDHPPRGVILASALQQTAVVLVFLFPAIVIIREVGAPPGQAAAILSMTLVACALGAVLQAGGARFGLGCGYLAPLSPATAYLAPSLLAAQAGGLPLIAGMTVTAGFAVVLLSRGLQRMRRLLPPEIAGVVALIIGISVAVAGARILVPAADRGPPTAPDLGVAALTLAVAVGLSVWGRGLYRYACVLIAMAAGYLAAILLGTAQRREGFDPAALPLVGLPDLGHLGLAFDIALLPAFLVSALAAALKTVGLVATLQKLNDADWVRPEPRSVAAGVAGDGIATACAGLLGAGGLNMSTTNVTVQQATGVTSRVIAYGTAAVCLALALFPRAGATLSEVPGPVLGATLIYAGGLMVVNGMQLATSRLLDIRRSLAVGLGVTAALAVETTPQIAGWVPPGLRPLMTATAFGTVVAIALNALLRIGVRRTVVLSLPVAELSEAAAAEFTLRAGASWGARADVIARAADVVSWCADAIGQAGQARGDVKVAISFDEFRIDILITYAGMPITLAERAPSAEELLEQEGAAALLAGHLVLRRAHKATVRHRDGVTEIRLAMEH